LNDIIDNYFRNKKIGILRESCIDIQRLLDLKEKIGGEIILNHPGKYGSHLKEGFISGLKEIGVDGLEKLSPHHSYGTVMYLQHIARKYDMIETGGSDFHVHAGSNYPVQNSWEYFEIKDDHLRKVREIIE
jgi:hypothetical protein